MSRKAQREALWDSEAAEGPILRSASSGGARKRSERINRGGSGSKGRGRFGPVHLPFTREDFVKANFQFVLSPRTTCDSRRGQDKLAWDEIESVVVRSEEAVCCPLCLDEIRAPRLTTCGHMFCCTCLYRLFMHAAQSTEYCPLCQSFIREKELRRVSEILLFDKISKEMGPCTFLLMSRPRAGIVPMPVAEKTGEYSHRKLPLIESKRARFSRLVLETQENVMRVCRKEVEDLQIQLNEAQSYHDHFGLEIVRRAYQDVQEMSRRWMNRDGVLEEDEEEASKKKSVVSATMTEDLGNGDVFFYQITDGRLVFLDSFNMKCLYHEFGRDASLFPPVLEKCKIVNVENVVLTPDVVKRNSYMVHVPIHANVYFIEIDMTEIVSQETLDHFSEEKKKRAEFRAGREKAERKHEKQIQDRKKRMLRDGVPLDGDLVDYKDYMERRREQEERIERELAHAFDASLTGEAISEEAINAMLDQQQEQQQAAGGVWSSTPAHIGSFASIVNNQGHFPELSSAALSSSPQSQHSLSSSPGKGWTVLSSGNQISSSSSSAPSSWTNADQEKQTGKKKNGGKKRILFASGNRRNYR